MNAMKSTFRYSVEFGELKGRMSEVPVDKDSSGRWLHALLDKRAAPGDAGVNNVSKRWQSTQQVVDVASLCLVCVAVPRVYVPCVQRRDRLTRARGGREK